MSPSLPETCDNCADSPFKQFTPRALFKILIYKTKMHIWETTAYVTNKCICDKQNCIYDQQKCIYDKQKCICDKQMHMWQTNPYSLYYSYVFRHSLRMVCTDRPKHEGIVNGPTDLFVTCLFVWFCVNQYSAMCCSLRSARNVAVHIYQAMCCARNKVKAVKAGDLSIMPRRKQTEY